MRYGSLCSGIEAASVAWEPLGWQPAWFAEIEPFPCAVLAHHWPHVPNHGDMTLLVPQRRRRVFVIASAGSIRPAEILFERQSQAGHPATGAETGQNPAAAAPAGSHWDDPINPHPTLNQSGFGDYIQDDTASTVKARDHKDATDLIVVHGRQDPCISDKAFALDCQHSGNTNVVCIYGNIINKNPEGTSGGNGMGAIQDGTSYTLTATDRHAVSDGLQVRRLMPAECERLQGFPAGHTQIPWRGKPAADCPDSLRYKAIGNSMAVPVMRWIGQRIRQLIPSNPN